MNQTTRSGYLYAMGAFGLWGIIPLYFKALDPVASADIVSWRIVFGLPVLALLVWTKSVWGEVRSAFTDMKIFWMLVGSAVLIGINWLVYVIGVNSGHVLATSLGYYLNPLINILLGHFLLKERLGPLRWGALAIAGIGVAILGAGASDLWITLTLAFSFAFYGYLRKLVNVGASAGLFVETVLLAPVGLVWMVWFRDTSLPLMGPSMLHLILIVLAGLVTVVPLLFFTEATRRLPYSTIGILQFFAPTIQFILAVSLFGEAFTPMRMLAFACIWTAMGLYIWSLVKQHRTGANTALASTGD